MVHLKTYVWVILDDTHIYIYIYIYKVISRYPMPKVYCVMLSVIKLLNLLSEVA